MTTPMTRSTGPRRSGFTLMEVLVAAVIVGLAVTAGSRALGFAVTSKHELDEAPFTASLLAKEIYVCAEGLDRTPSGIVGVESGDDLVALDNLIGARFSPPIRADGTPDATLAEWTQRVSLDVYALGDLSTPTGEDAWRSLGTHADRVYQLSVTMLEGRDEVDTFRWWLTP